MQHFDSNSFIADSIIEKKNEYRNVKIIATIGPASATEECLRSLIQAGVDCFRINFSHGNGETLQPLIEMIRNVEKKEGANIPILADIQGPKIRIGTLPGNGVVLTEGTYFTITTREIGEGDETTVSTGYTALPRDVIPGSRILLADGSIEMTVEEIKGNDVICRTIIGGRLYSNKGINLPHTHLSVETLTEKDRKDLDYISHSDIDLVAISFVRSPHDVIRAQALLGSNKFPIVAKLERPEALDKLDEILEVSDGVMVARGDLGVEIEFEKVPLIQKKILDRASLRGKWAVVATQMLGSMVKSSRPTRAEVTDVANAVMEGADAVMLSEETATGMHPVEAVAAMRRIIEQASSFRDGPT